MGFCRSGFLLRVIFLFLFMWSQWIPTNPLIQAEIVPHIVMPPIPTMMTQSMPEKIARIQSSYFPAESNGHQKPIIIIQDSHANYEVQKNVDISLQYIFHQNPDLLNHVEHLKIGIEGASGLVDTSFFKTYPDQSHKVEVLDYFMQQGKLSGAEFHQILENREIQLFGLESDELYLMNKAIYADLLNNKESFDLIWKEWMDSIRHLLGQTFLGDALNFWNLYLAKSQQKMELWDYIEKLDQVWKYADENSMIHRVGQWIQSEKNINYTNLAQEEDSVINLLGKKIQGDALVELVQNTLYYRDGHWTMKEYYQYLIQKINDLHINIDSLSNWKQVVSLLHLRSQIDEAVLEDELIEFETKISNQVFSKENISYWKAYQNLELIEKMIQLEVARGDWNMAKLDQELDLVSIQNLFQKLSHSKKIFFNNISINDFSTRIKKAKEYYSVALTRDQAFWENIQKQYDENSLVVVFIGGFHTFGLTRYLKQNQRPYIVINPRVPEGTHDKAQELYHQLIINSSFQNTLHQGSLIDFINADPERKLMVENAFRQEVAIHGAITQAALAENWQQFLNTWIQNLTDSKTDANAEKIESEIALLNAFQIESILEIKGSRYLLINQTINGQNVQSMMRMTHVNQLNQQDQIYNPLGFIGNFAIETISSTDFQGMIANMPAADWMKIIETNPKLMESFLNVNVDAEDTVMNGLYILKMDMEQRPEIFAKSDFKYSDYLSNIPDARAKKVQPAIQFLMDQGEVMTHSEDVIEIMNILRMNDLSAALEKEDFQYRGVKISTERVYQFLLNIEKLSRQFPYFGFVKQLNAMDRSLHKQFVNILGSNISPQDYLVMISLFKDKMSNIYLETPDVLRLSGVSPESVGSDQTFDMGLIDRETDPVAMALVQKMAQYFQDDLGVQAVRVMLDFINLYGDKTLNVLAQNSVGVPNELIEKISAWIRGYPRYQMLMAKVAGRTMSYGETLAPEDVESGQTLVSLEEDLASSETLTPEQLIGESFVNGETYLDQPSGQTLTGMPAKELVDQVEAGEPALPNGTIYIDVRQEGQPSQPTWAADQVAEDIVVDQELDPIEVLSDGQIEQITDESIQQRESQRASLDANVEAVADLAAAMADSGPKISANAYFSKISALVELMDSVNREIESFDNLPDADKQTEKNQKQAVRIYRALSQLVRSLKLLNIYVDSPLDLEQEPLYQALIRFKNIIPEDQRSLTPDIQGKILEGKNGRYQILGQKPLGEGGMGAAWLAKVIDSTEAIQDEIVVVKMTLPTGNEKRDRQMMRLLKYEASVQTRYSTIRLIDENETDSPEDYFMVQELAFGFRGEGYNKVMYDKILKSANGRLDIDGAIDVLTEAEAIIEAMGQVHSDGIIHLDVKPENMVQDPISGKIVFIDLGISRIAVDLGDGRVGVKGSNYIAGTPGFIAPERFAEEDLDFRSDWFAVGSMLFQMVTGVNPFTQGNPNLNATIFRTTIDDWNQILHTMNKDEIEKKLGISLNDLQLTILRDFVGPFLVNNVTKENGRTVRANGRIESMEQALSLLDSFRETFTRSYINNQSTDTSDETLWTQSNRGVDVEVAPPKLTSSIGLRILSDSKRLEALTQLIWNAASHKKGLATVQRLLVRLGIRSEVLDQEIQQTHSENVVDYILKKRLQELIHQFEIQVDRVGYENAKQTRSFVNLALFVQNYITHYEHIMQADKKSQSVSIAYDAIALYFSDMPDDRVGSIETYRNFFLDQFGLTQKEWAAQLMNTIFTRVISEKEKSRKERPTLTPGDFQQVGAST